MAIGCVKTCAQCNILNRVACKKVCYEVLKLIMHLSISVDLDNLKEMEKHSLPSTSKNNASTPGKAVERDESSLINIHFNH